MGGGQGEGNIIAWHFRGQGGGLLWPGIAAFTLKVLLTTAADNMKIRKNTKKIKCLLQVCLGFKG